MNNVVYSMHGIQYWAKMFLLKPSLGNATVGKLIFDFIYFFFLASIITELLLLLEMCAFLRGITQLLEQEYAEVDSFPRLIIQLK